MITMAPHSERNYESIVLKALGWVLEGTLVVGFDVTSTKKNIDS